MTVILTIPRARDRPLGVPRPALGWGACDPNNPKNRRRRCSLLAEKGGANGLTRVLIDTSPDLREQLIDANVDHLEATFLTHEHADQTHGIDDLRSVVLHQRKRIPVYLNKSTGKDILSRFSYCFEQAPGSDYPAILEKRSIEAGETESIEGKGGSLALTAFLVQHGNIPALGYRHRQRRLHARSPRHSAREFPRAGKSRSVDHRCVALCTASRAHFSLDDALSWIAKFKPRRAVLTNLHSDLDYDVLQAKLPPGIDAGYDGMRLAIDA